MPVPAEHEVTSQRGGSSSSRERHSSHNSHRGALDGQSASIVLGQDLGEDGRFSRKPTKRSTGFLLDSSLPPPTLSGRTSLSYPDAANKAKGHRGHLGSTSGRRNPKTQISLQHPGSSRPAEALLTDPSLALENDGSKSKGTTTESENQKTNANWDDNPTAMGNQAPNLQAPPVSFEEHERRDAADSGLDLDSARIINLALNLNERRRRSAYLPTLQAQGGADSSQRVSPVPSHKRRNVSEGAASHGATGERLKEHFIHQRQAMRATSTASRTTRPVSGSSAHTAPVDHRSSGLSSVGAPIIRSPDDPHQPYHFSKSTLDRAEKARATLELWAEYRRLLQYLPPLEPSLSAQCHGLGRPYNPLQCIRNRKLRARERQPSNFNLESWSNVTKVKAWVDLVKTASSKASAVSEPVPMPSFLQSHHDSGGTEVAPSSQSPKGQSTRVTTRRHGIDWLMTPEECLADACWLEQNAHKSCIEGRDGNRLFGGREQLLARADRRNRRVIGDTDTDMTDEGSVDSDNQYNTLSLDNGRVNPQSKLKDYSHHRVNSLQDRYDERGRARRHLRPRIIRLHTQSPSSSSSDGPNERRFRIRRGREKERKDSFTVTDSALLQKQMATMLLQETEDMDRPTSDLDQNSYQYDMADDTESDFKRFSSVRTFNDKVLTNFWHKRGRSDQIKYLGGDSIASKQYNTSSDALEPPRLSFEGSDITLPPSSQINSVARSVEGTHTRMPSAATSLSPPDSRQASPTRGLLQKLGSKAGFARSTLELERSNVNVNDFAFGDDEQGSTPEGTQKLSRARTAPAGRQEASSAKRVPMEALDETNLSLKMPPSQLKKELRDAKAPEQSRIRALFKGTRLEGVFRTEAPRFGGLIWRNEVSTTSNPAKPGPDGEGSEDDSALSNRHPRTTTPEQQFSGGGNARKHRARNYFAPSPVFTSQPEISTTLLTDNHSGVEDFKPDRSAKTPNPTWSYSPPVEISTTSSPERSERFYSGTKRSARSSVDHQQSDFDFTTSSKLTNQTIPNAVREADSKLRTVLGSSNQLDRDKIPVTGSSGHESPYQDPVILRPKVRKRRQWSVYNSESSSYLGQPGRRDIARLHALLLSSGVKAREIVGRTKGTLSSPEVVLSNSSQNDQYKAIAEGLTSDIEATLKDVRDSAKRLDSFRTPDLLGQIEDIKTRMTSELTPKVQASMDDADALGIELTTVHILAMKELNDSVERMMRRQRRRLRWLRRRAYVLLEWTLLGLMWWAWLIVVVVRIVRTILRGVIKAIRWILWV